MTPAPEHGSRPDARAPRPLVCVIDDDAAMLRAIGLLLRAANFATRTFASAEQFLESAHDDPADCLLVDVQLGGLSGLHLQARLASSGSSIPIVFITAREDRQVRERALQAGAAAFLQKPFNDDVLVGAIREAIGK